MLGVACAQKPIPYDNNPAAGKFYDTLAQLSAIKAPSLIICGHRDLIPVSHTDAIYQNIPHANLWSFPTQATRRSSKTPKSSTAKSTTSSLHPSKTTHRFVILSEVTRSIIARDAVEGPAFVFVVACFFFVIPEGNLLMSLLVLLKSLGLHLKNHVP